MSNIPHPVHFHSRSCSTAKCTVRVGVALSDTAVDGPCWQTTILMLLLSLSLLVAPVCKANGSDLTAGIWGHIVIGDAPEGALIVDIDRFGPISRAGLYDRDVVVAAGDSTGANMRKISNAADLQAIIDESKPFQAMTLRLLRYGKSLEIVVLPRGANRIQLKDYHLTFSFPWNATKPAVFPSNKLEELDNINVLTQIAIDDKTGNLSLIGHYDPRFKTGGIPYLDILKTALAYPEPSVSFPGSTIRSWVLSKDTGTLQLLPSLLAMPEAENERQIIIRQMSQRLGISRQEYVDLYNYGYLDADGGLAPAPINGIILKSMRHLGWMDAAAAYELLLDGRRESTIRALKTLGVQYQWLNATDTDNKLDDRLTIAVIAAIINRVGTSPSFPRHTEDDLKELIARAESGDIGSADLQPALKRFYRFVPVDMFDVKGTSLQLDVLNNMVISGAPAAILSHSSGIAPVSILAKDIERGSQLARILAETDYSMKALTVRPELFEGVPGFKTLEQFRLERLTSDECRNIPIAWWRWTFVPRKTEMKISPSGHVVQFGISDVTVDNGLAPDDINAGLIDKKQMSPAKLKLLEKYQKINEEWYARIAHDYDRYAELLPALHEFREAAKVVALARWANSKKLALNLDGVFQVSSGLPQTFDSQAWFHLEDPSVASNHLGNEYLLGVPATQQFEAGWAGSIIGGASLKGKSWTTYTPSKTTETEVSDQMVLSRDIGQAAVEVAESGDLETARYLAELSAQALAGGISRAEIAERGIVPVEMKSRKPVSPAALELQKELLRSTGRQIEVLKSQPDNGEAASNIRGIAGMYEELRLNPSIAEKRLEELQAGKLLSTSSLGGAEQKPRPGAYSCAVCYDGLLRNIGSKVNNEHMLSTFVDGALGYYRNCKQKANGSCGAGDQFSKQLRVCDDRRENESDYAVCIRQLMCFAGHSAINCSE